MLPAKFRPPFRLFGLTLGKKKASEVQATDAHAALSHIGSEADTQGVSEHAATSMIDGMSSSSEAYATSAVSSGHDGGSVPVLGADLDGDAKDAFLLNGKWLVSGLSWRPPAPRAQRALTRKRGIEEGFQFAGQHRADSLLQIGFAHASFPQGQPAYSLAALLAHQIKDQNWIGVFRLPDTRYALIAVHQGVVMAGRDIIGYRHDVEPLFQETLQLLEETGGRWGTVYAPEEFSTRYEEAALAALLPKAKIKSFARLAPLSSKLTKRQLGMMGVGVLLCLGLGGAWWGWSTYQAKLQLQLQALTAHVVDVPPPHPWATQYTGAAYAQQWRALSKNLPLSVAGWRLDQLLIGLDDKQADGGAWAKYEREDQGAPLAEFMRAAHLVFSDAPVPDPTASRAMIALTPFDPVSRTRDEVVLGSLGQGMESLATYTQKMGLALPKFTEAVAALPPPPAYVPGHARRRWAPPGWRVMRWTLSASLPPEVVLASLDRIPGLRVTGVQADFGVDKMNWTLQGYLYAKK